MGMLIDCALAGAENRTQQYYTTSLSHMHTHTCFDLPTPSRFQKGSAPHTKYATMFALVATGQAPLALFSLFL